ncbi:hypothetical protein ES703_114910 [subsurface metagenome]
MLLTNTFIPSDPKTAAQVIQRRKFAGCLYAIRHIGATLWQADFNRAIGQLPGFQSMMSIAILNTDDAFVMTAPPDTPLGNLHYGGSMAVVVGVGVAGDIDLSWTAELGLNGTDADVVEVFGFGADEIGAGTRRGVDFAATATRVDALLVVPTGTAGQDWIIGIYFQGAGVAEGLLSECHWFAVTSMA